MRTDRLLVSGMTLLLLVGAFQFGVRSALGQAGRRVVAGGVLQGLACGVDEGGMLWLMGGSLSGRAGPIAPPKPGRIVALDCNFGNTPSEPVLWVLFEDGDFFLYAAGTWRPSGNLFAGGSVPTLGTTWGQIKARYREVPEQGNALVGPRTTRGQTKELRGDLRGVQIPDGR